MKKALFNIFMAIVIWYGSQWIVGFIIGFIANIMGYTSIEEIFIPLAISGIVSSVISEVIYWTHVSKKEGA